MDEGLDVFADEHMVEMNKRILPREKRRSRPLTPSRVNKTSPPTEDEMPPTLQAEPTNHNEEQLPVFVSTSLPEEPVDKTPVDKTPVDKTPVDKTPMDKTPVDKTTPVDKDKTPMDKTTLVDKTTPVDKTTLVDKLTSSSRKRERTPSPTYNTSKRPALSNSSLTKFTSSALPGSKVTAGVKSYASKVLTEELQKQQGVENSRLKSLIVKEVRKPGKSKL